MSRDERALPSVDVVICAYTDERWAEIVRAVDSVAAQDSPAHAIMVVIDHNDDLFDRAVAELDHDLVRVMRNVQEQGLSGARNTGLAEAEADVVAFLDDDAWAEPAWLRSFQLELADASVMGVGGRVLPDWRSERPSWFPDEFGWVVGCTYRGVPEERAPIRNPIGASMAFRTDALREAGGFDAGLGRIGKKPVGCEETELSIRVRRAHGPESIVYAPDCVVHHAVTAERATVGYFVRRGWSEGRSKAVVAARTGSDEALEAERRYVTSTLPGGVIRGLVSPFAGWMQAAMILVGTTSTGLGYVVGILRRDRDVVAAGA